MTHLDRRPKRLHPQQLFVALMLFALVLAILVGLIATKIYMASQHRGDIQVITIDKKYSELNDSITINIPKKNLNITINKPTTTTTTQAKTNQTITSTTLETVCMKGYDRNSFGECVQVLPCTEENGCSHNQACHPSDGSDGNPVKICCGGFAL